MHSSTAVGQPARAAPHAYVRRKGRRAARVIVTPAKSRRIDRLAGWPALLWLLLVSALLHEAVNTGIGVLGLLRLSRPPPAAHKIEVQVIEHKPPPPPPIPKVELPKPPPPKPPPPKPQPKPQPVNAKPPPLPPPPIPQPSPTPPPKAALPPPTMEAPKTTAAPVLVQGFKMESTTVAGSMAVPQGNTQAPVGTPQGVTPKPYHADNYVPSYSLAQQPELVDDMSDDEMKKYYPADAKRDGDEAQVPVKVEIDEHGNVTKVIVVTDPGHGFAEATRKLWMHRKYKPGRDASGKPCATTISWTINWELN